MNFKKILKKIKSFIKNNAVPIMLVVLIVGLPLLIGGALYVKKNELSIGAGVWYILAFVLIFILWRIEDAIVEKKRRAKLTCDHCKQIYYEEDIDWIETNVQISEHKDPVSKEIYFTEVSNVLFTCTCHNCQNMKKFTHKFVKSHKDKTYNLEALIEKYLDLDFRRKIEAKAEKQAQSQAKKLEKELIEEQKRLGIDEENILKNKEEQTDFANETKKDE